MKKISFNFKKTLCAVGAVGLLAGAQSAFAVSDYNTSAYEVQPQGFGHTQNSLGISAVYNQNIYSGVDSQVLPFPLLNFTYNNFFLQNITAGYHAYTNDYVQASLILAPNFQGYNADDSDELSGMNDAEPSLNAGGRLMLKTKPIVTTLSAVHDISGRTAGNTASAKFSTGLPLMDKRLVLSPSVTFAYQDSNVVNYYYGVGNSEATATRSAYSPGGTINTTAGLVAMYKLSQHWQTNFTYMFTKFGNEIADSPIVSRSTSSTVLLGISYLFGEGPN